MSAWKARLRSLQKGTLQKMVQALQYQTPGATLIVDEHFQSMPPTMGSSGQRPQHVNYRITKGGQYQHQAYTDTLYEQDSINSPRGPYQVHVTRVGHDVPRNEVISLNDSGSQTISAPDGPAVSTVPGDSE